MTDPRDPEFEALLAGHADLRADYRDAGRDVQPPAHLDAAILAASRRAVGADPRAPARAPGWRRWRVPVAAAAVIVIAASVTVLSGRRHETLLDAGPPPAPVAAASKSTAGADRSREDAVASAPAPAPASSREAGGTAASAPTPHRAAIPAGAAAPSRASEASRRMAEEVAPAPVASARPEAPSVAGARVDPSGSDATAGNSMPLPVAAPPAAPAAAKADMAAGAVHEGETASADTATRAEPARDVRETARLRSARMPAAATRAETAVDPFEAGLAEIRALTGRGRRAEAQAAWERLHCRFPDRPLPADLADALAPAGAGCPPAPAKDGRPADR